MKIILDGLSKSYPDRDPRAEDVAELLATVESPSGRLRYVAPAVRMSETPSGWTRPPVPLGIDAPVWPE